jgi:hypothetical protein
MKTTARQALRFAACARAPMRQASHFLPTNVRDTSCMRRAAVLLEQQLGEGC